jgi:hypothetical protein
LALLGARPAPKLQSLGLRLSDLLPQTSMDSARAWSNFQAARRDDVSVALYDQHGRMLSYQDSFTRNVINGSGHIWLLHADSELTAFRATSGARWNYGRLCSAFERDHKGVLLNNRGCFIQGTGNR